MTIRNIYPLVVISLTCLQPAAVMAQEPVIAPTADYSAFLHNVIVADLQSDNAPEVIGLDNNSNSVVVMLNQGDGTYGPPSYYGVDIQANGLAVGDFNGDGRLDVAVALGSDSSSNGYVAVLLNAGHGMLQKPVYYKVPVPANSIAVADFNKDNRADIAVIGNKNNNGTNTVVILTNTGSSFSQHSFAAAIYFSPDFNQPNSDYVEYLAAGDFDGDGRIDLAYVDKCSVCDIEQEKIFILANTISGWQTAMMFPSDFHVNSGTFSLTAADLDGDGRTDLVTPYRGCYYPHCGGVKVIFMDRGFIAGNVQELDVPNPDTGPLPEKVVIGDFNNDGLMDMAGSSNGGDDQNYINVIPPGLMMWTASGKRSFNKLTYYDSPGNAYFAAPVATGFLNKDGTKDLVAPAEGGLQVWMNTTSNPGDPCSYPTSGGVHVCAPMAKVPSGTVRFIASARTNTQPLFRFELWIDGRRRYVLSNDRLDVKIPVADGTHEAVFVEVGASSLHISKTISFTVGN
jgi:hypothetical protein